MNSSPASSQISRSSASTSSRDARGDLLQPLGCRASRPRAPSRAGRARAAARRRRSRPLEPALVAAAGAAQRGERVHEHARRAAAVGRSTSTADPALLAQLVERVAAARGVEQVGGDQRVVREVAPAPSPSDLASCATPAARRAAATSSAGVAALARQRLGPAGVGRRSATSLAAANSAPSGRLGRRARRAPARSPGSVARSPSAPRARARSSAVSAVGARRGRLGAPSASSSRRSGSRSSKSRKTSRSRERSGVAARPRATSIVDRRCRDGSWRAACEIRASSACSIRFSWRLAPEISSTCASTSSSVPYCCSSCGGGLVADARDAGDVVGRVALEADEVGDQLGRDPVALDHALAVVDPRVGDPARGRHDPHAVVDELVGVAVAGHDHHGDARRLAPARRAWRSRRRPRSPRRETLRSRTPRPAARGAATARLSRSGRDLRCGLVLGVDLLAARRAGVPDHDRRPSARTR